MIHVPWFSTLINLGLQKSSFYIDFIVCTSFAFGGNYFVNGCISLGVFCGLFLNCCDGALIYFRTPHCTTLPFLPSCLHGTPRTQTSNLGWMFFHCLHLVSLASSCLAALELLGFGKHGKAADGIVCGRLLLLHMIFFWLMMHWNAHHLLDVSESPRNFAHIPIYGHKDYFSFSLAAIYIFIIIIFFLPCSLCCCNQLLQAFQSCVSAVVPDARLSLKKTGTCTARKLEIAGGFHYSNCRLILLSQ